MDTTYIIGQALGFLLMVQSIFIYSCKKRSHIVAMQLISNVLGCLQNAMIGAFTGSFIFGIATARDIVFFNREKHTWAKSKIWLIIFLASVLISPVLTWAGVISLVPTIGSIFFSVGLYLLNPKATRVLGIIGLIFWGIYYGFTLNVGPLIGNVIAVIIGGFSLIFDVAKEQKAKKQKFWRTSS